jgi:phosphonate transport system substrate-binding protein
VPTYAALFEVLDSGAADAGWTPPLVALDLARCGTATPVLALSRGRTPRYHAVLLARGDGPVRGLADLAGRSVGWVAPESASGYVVPRLHLAALGLDLAGFFARETFFGSHARSCDALAAGEVDAIATYAHVDENIGRIAAPPIGAPTRMLAAAGPIPADVIVVRESLSPARKHALTTALAAMSDAERASLVPLIQARRFVRVGGEHLDPLRTLAARAAEKAFAPVGPRAA